MNGDNIVAGRWEIRTNGNLTIAKLNSKVPSKFMGPLPWVKLHTGKGQVVTLKQVTVCEHEGSTLIYTTETPIYSEVIEP